MTTYTDVTNLPSAPVSTQEGDTHVNLVRSGYPDQKYIYSAGPTGAWIAVVDEDDVIATDSVFLQQKTQKFSYSFAIDGGAVGNITLRGGTIPSGAVVCGALSICTGAITAGASGTMKMSLESDGDLQGIINTADFTATGSIGGVVGGGFTDPVVFGSLLTFSYGATPPAIVTTSAQSVVLAVGTAALLTGTFDLYLTYMMPV